MNKIEIFRQSKPIKELERKAKKARRKSFFTQEDIDLAKGKGKLLYDFFNKND